MEKFDSAIPVRYGIIAFAAAFTTGMMMYVFYQTVVSNFMMYAAVGFISLALVLFLAIWSGINYRREHGGIISFQHAFLAVFTIFLFNSVATFSTQLLINKVIDKQYAQKASSLLKEKMTDYFDKNNIPEDKAKDAMAGIGPEKFDPPLLEVLKSFLTWLGVGGIISVLIALFIKRGSSDLIPTDSPPEPIRTI